MHNPPNFRGNDAARKFYLFMSNRLEIEPCSVMFLIASAKSCATVKTLILESVRTKGMVLHTTNSSNTLF